MYLDNKVKVCLIILGLILGVYGVISINYSEKEVNLDDELEVYKNADLKSSAS